jgi:glycosyltransferase involved in cell wall biosynthesis
MVEFGDASHDNIRKRARKLLFISWAKHCSRSDSIAGRLGGTSLMIYSSLWGSRYSTVLFKYLTQSLRTARVLLRYKPRTVLVMTPPVVACIPVWLYAKLTGAQYAIDAHSGAFLDRRWMSILFVHKFFSRHAKVTLVTSTFLANMVTAWGAKTQIVSDVPVCFPEPRLVKRNGHVTMTFVSTFTGDEPLENFLVAAGRAPDVQFYVTGRLEDAEPEVLKKAPGNVSFTDFLSDSDYVGLLMSSDAVICLTTEDHTMQRGAYEAVYLGKPVITSDFEILRKSFPSGSVHVTGTPEDIARGICEMKGDLRRYQREVAHLRTDKLECWRVVENTLRTLFGQKGTEASLDHIGTGQL